MSKAIGDLGEINFILKSKKLGLTVLTPYSSACVYDIALDNGKDIIKVQVKTCNTTDSRGAYQITLCRGRRFKRSYDKYEIDYIAVYIMPLDKFFIIPVDDIIVKSIRFYPSKKSCRLSKYLERWDYFI